MKITRSGECGNSPKNAFVEDFIIDVVAGRDVSDRLVEGAEAARPAWADATALRVVHAISHGRVGAGNGVVTRGDIEIQFALILDFANTKGDRVKSFRLYAEAA